MFSGYCAGWSLRVLLEEGLNGVPAKTESGAPKHLTSAVNQMVNFFGTLQNEWAGAQAFSSFDTYLSPFVKKYSLEIEEEINNSGFYNFPSEEVRQKFIDDKTYKYVKQNIQSFVFNLNIPSRWGTQTPFTNITTGLDSAGRFEKPKVKNGRKIFPLRFQPASERNGYAQQGLCGSDDRRRRQRPSFHFSPFRLTISPKILTGTIRNTSRFLR